jgi:nucleoside-diphosphate-sugar epimerase
MRLFVTGATGFTGSRLVPLLLQNGFQVRCLYRPTSDRSVLAVPVASVQGDIDWVQGDVSDTDALSAAMQGAHALINVVSLGFGHANSIILAAQNAGVNRSIFISTTAIFTQLDAKSKSIRMDAERAVEHSGLNYTILRPTMIYGSARDRNMWRLIQFMRYSPIVPTFGDGESFQQPIYVDDVAQAILGCLRSEKTICKSYNIAGKYPLTYNAVIDTIAVQMKKRIWKLHIPYAPVVAAMKFFERLHLPFPIKTEQVLRLNESKNFDYTAAANDFGFNPLSFEDGIKMELGTS